MLEKSIVHVLFALKISWCAMLINWKRRESPITWKREKVRVPMYFAPAFFFDKCWPIPKERIKDYELRTSNTEQTSY